MDSFQRRKITINAADVDVCIGFNIDGSKPAQEVLDFGLLLK